MPIHKNLSLSVKMEEKIVGLSCDKCQKEYVAEGGDPTLFGVSDNYVPSGFHTFIVSGGYSSSFPQDGDTLKIVVCDGCLKDWVSSFGSKPEESSFISQIPTKVLFGDNTLYLNGGMYLTADEYPDYSRIDNLNKNCEYNYHHSNGEVMESTSDDGPFVEIYQAALIVELNEWVIIYRIVDQPSNIYRAMAVSDFDNQFSALKKEL